MWFGRLGVRAFGTSIDARGLARRFRPLGLGIGFYIGVKLKLGLGLGLELTGGATVIVCGMPSPTCCKSLDIMRTGGATASALDEGEVGMPNSSGSSSLCSFLVR